jgi:hypothetical protein
MKIRLITRAACAVLFVTLAAGADAAAAALPSSPQEGGWHAPAASVVADQPSSFDGVDTYSLRGPAHHALQHRAYVQRQTAALLPAVVVPALQSTSTAR